MTFLDKDIDYAMAAARQVQVTHRKENHWRYIEPFKSDLIEFSAHQVPVKDFKGTDLSV